MKHLYYIFILLCLFWGCTQNKAKYANSSSSKDSIDIYLEQANNFDLLPKKREIYTQKAFTLIRDQENDSLHRVNLFRVANRYFNLDNWKKYKETVDLVLEKSISRKDSASIGRAYSYSGDYYGIKGVSDTAYFYYSRAEKIYLKLNDNINLAKTRLSKAQIQNSESDFSGAEKSVFNALRALKGEKENDVLYECYNLLGIVYNDLVQYSLALEYYDKALAVLEDKNIPTELQSKATSMNNIGFVYQNMNQHQRAIAYFENGLENKKNLILYKPLLYITLLDNLGYSRFKSVNNNGLPGLFYKSIKVRDSLGLAIGMISPKIHLSEYFAVKGDTLKALSYSIKALSEARKSKNARNLLLPLKQLAVLEPKKAVAYNKEYIHINDSLQKAERIIGEKFTRIEYETDQIKEENSSLTTKNRNLVYIFGSVLILGMFLYIIKAQKTKNRELLYKQEQQQANEEIYNLLISQQNSVDAIRIKEKQRVAQELHDGVLGRMFGVRMNLDSSNAILDETGIQARNEFILELKNIEQDIREISHDLSREKSELINNFVAIVEELIEKQKKSFETQLISIMDSDIDWGFVNNAIKINLYRILQESFQNINKYAKANAIKVEFKKDDNRLFLAISDNGVGFNTNKGRKGIGLQNMISRMKECQGTFEITSEINQGTTIKVSVPI